LLGFSLTGSFPLGGLALASLRAAGSLLNRTGTTIKRQLKTLPSHSEQKNDYPAWMILISSGSASPDFLKWFKDF
jgi:hypothetical protein